MDMGIISDDDNNSDGKDNPWKPLVHEREEEVRNVAKGVDKQPEQSDNAPDENQQHTTNFDDKNPTTMESRDSKNWMTIAPAVQGLLVLHGRGQRYFTGANRQDAIANFTVLRIVSSCSF
jgi:hypothetical protein